MPVLTLLKMFCTKFFSQLVRTTIVFYNTSTKYKNLAECISNIFVFSTFLNVYIVHICYNDVIMGVGAWIKCVVHPFFVV